MDKLDKLLQTDELTVKTVGNPKNGGILKKIIIGATIALGITGGVVMTHHNNPTVDNNKDTIKVNDPSLLSVVKDAITNQVKKEVKENHFLVNDSPLVNENNKQALNEAGNFELESKLADNQIARKVSQIQFAKGNYVLSLGSEGEGFRSHLYNDNIKVAFANGWNVGLQDAKYNKNLALAISKDQHYINQISSLSGKESVEVLPQEYKALTISPQRSMQVMLLMTEKFQQGVIDGIAGKLPNNTKAVKLHNTTHKSYKDIALDVYNNLQENEKAAVLYHTYKVGSGGFAKYNNLINSLINYSLDNEKSLEMRKDVAEKFTYKYKSNGKVLEDTRASILVSSMFADPQAFGYIIGKNVAPQNMKSLVPSFAKYNIDGQAEPGKVVLPDPVGEEKAKLEKEGKRLEMILLPEKDPAEMIQNLRKKPSTPYGFGIMG